MRGTRVPFLPEACRGARREIPEGVQLGWRALVIRHNSMALFAHRQMGLHNNALSKALQRLSSGYRINSAADDPAGFAISERMRAQIAALSRASLNAGDGISMLSTAEGALQEVHGMLNRLTDLATHAANGIMGASDRNKLQAEANQILEEIGRISKASNFGGTQLLDGTGGENEDGQIKLFVGDSDAEHNWISLNMPNLGQILADLGPVDLTSSGSASLSLERIKNGIEQVSSARGYLGASVNRLEYTIRSLDNTLENLTEAESRIRDADMAKEMMNFVRAQVLSQAAMFMMSHAMQQPYRILQLLRSV